MATSRFSNPVLKDRRLTPMARMLIVGVISLFLVMMMTPFGANGMEATRCTAKSNVDSTDTDILGATETRITLEAQAGEDEAVTAVSFTMPEGTSFSAPDSEVQLIEKDANDPTKPGKRVQLTNAAMTSQGTTLFVDFGETAPTGSLVRLTVANVYFPSAGGEMQFTGTCTLEDGSTVDIQNIPSIQVTGITPAEQLSNKLAEQDWVKAWNSNTFLHLFLDPTVLVTSFPVVARGFGMALAIVFIAFPLAIPFGLLLALMRMSKLKILRGLASIYVNIIRGTPVFLQIYIAFFGLPLAGIVIPNFPLGILVLAMNSCAYQCEIMRAGIQSIPKGQFEAARSLGMNGAQTMFFVIIPQTVRRIIPTMTNEFILLYKDTSLLAAVGIMEVVMYAKTIVANTGSITPYIVAAIFYLIITLPLAKLVGVLEKRLASNDAGTTGKKRCRRTKSVAAEEPGSTELPEGIAHDGVSGETRSPEVAKTVGEPANSGITPEKESSL